MALTTVPASLSATALTLTTAAQPNITSVGTLTGLTVSGNIAGTLTTAAQTNITSLGTLTALTISGDLTVDTSTLKVDSSNNRVGIGTDLPGARLQINTTSGIGQYIYNTTSAQAYINFGNSTTGVYPQNFSSAGGLLVGVDTDETAVLWNGTATALRLATSGTERMHITALGLVGIGRTPAYASLEVEGDKTLANNLQLQLNGATDTNKQMIMGFDTSTDKTYIISQIAGSASKELNLRNSKTNIGSNDVDIQITPHNINGTGSIYMRGNSNNDKSMITLNHYGHADYVIAAGTVSNGLFHIGRDGSTADFSLDNSGNIKLAGLVGINKVVNTAVALSVGADATTTSSYALEVCNSSANTRFLVDGVGNSYFYKSDNAVGMKFDATNGRLGIGTGAGAVNYTLTVSGESSLGDFSANGFANLGRNADGNQDITTLGGYGVLSGSTRYGRYGVLRFRSSANYTSSSRGYMITNGYGANKFAIIQSTSATNMPDIAAAGGGAGNGNPVFVIDNSGAITNPYNIFVDATLSTNQGISGWTKVTHNQKTGTNNGGFSTSNSRFTAPVAGKYLVSVTVYLATANIPYIYTGIWKNGSAYRYIHGQNSVTTGTDWTYGGTIQIYLAENDYIEHYAYSNGSATIGSGTQRTSFSIYLLG